MAVLSRLADLLRVRPQADEQALRALRSQGYYVVSPFLDRATCSVLISQVEELFATYPEKVQHEHSEGTSGDFRILGGEVRASLLKDAIAGDPWLRGIANGYMRTDMATHFTMANRLAHVEGEICNSGAGWHRDSASKQFKAIVYLTDVGTENGPFTIVPASRDTALPARADARNKNRFDDTTIADLVRRINRQPVEVTGEAGTCILVDTSHVHRGKDIESGVRYAVTNYYYQDTLEKRRKTQEKWGRHLLQPLI